jgi:RNA polymerase sigma-70 factor, ECF subfamily
MTNANDLMSETVLATYERFHTLRDPQAFTSFLFTVATRIYRHKERRARWFGRINPGAANEIEAMDHSPELAMDIRLMHEAIASLPVKQSEAILLFELSGLSLEEIRAIQGGTLSGVKSRLRRARQELAKKLGMEPTAQMLDMERPARTEFPNMLDGSNNHRFFAIAAHE